MVVTLGVELMSRERGIVSGEKKMGNCPRKILFLNHNRMSGFLHHQLACCPVQKRGYSTVQSQRGCHDT